MTTQGKVVIRCREEKNDSDVTIFQLKYIFQKDINNSKNIFHWKSQKNIKDLVCNIVWFAEQELHKDNSWHANVTRLHSLMKSYRLLITNKEGRISFLQ